jgi:tRNA 2-selenouridine synthase
MSLSRYTPETVLSLCAHGFDTLIDVRAPDEFAHDHIPGAINLPVLSNAERAQVGTIYKQDSPFMARKLGAALVAQNAAHHLQTALADKPGGWQPLVYCWRGGQRSGSFATILSQIGWRVAVLEGGYKSWRQLVRTQLYDTAFPAPVVLLDGGTGTGKTDILTHAARQGAQVIDLEALAHHRGSIFGGIGGQPSQKLFETRLAQQVIQLDPARPVLIEAESNRIGAIRLPPALWDAMRAAQVVTVTATLEARTQFIARRYHRIAQDADGIRHTLETLRKHHSRALVAEWQSLAHDPAALAQSLIVHHYDPRYARVSRQGRTSFEITLPDLSDAALAQAADRLCRQLAEASPNSS